MTPVCTIMIGRLDDWLKVVAEKEGLIVTPGYLDWAGIAVLKKAYGIFHQRGYRARLLSAAFRHHLHWSETIGGNIVMTIPFAWQQRFNRSDVLPHARMEEPVAPFIVEQLQEKFVDFRRAYDAEGLTVPEFDTFGATVRTLRGFIASYDHLQQTLRDFLLPNPDK